MRSHYDVVNLLLSRLTCTISLLGRPKATLVVPPSQCPLCNIANFHSCGICGRYYSLLENSTVAPGLGDGCLEPPQAGCTAEGRAPSAQSRDDGRLCRERPCSKGSSPKKHLVRDYEPTRLGAPFLEWSTMQAMVCSLRNTP